MQTHMPNHTGSQGRVYPSLPLLLPPPLLHGWNQWMHGVLDDAGWLMSFPGSCVCVCVLHCCCSCSPPLFVFVVSVVRCCFFVLVCVCSPQPRRVRPSPSSVLTHLPSLPFFFFFCSLPSSLFVIPTRTCTHTWTLVQGKCRLFVGTHGKARTTKQGHTSKHGHRTSKQDVGLP